MSKPGEETEKEAKEREEAEKVAKEKEEAKKKAEAAAETPAPTPTRRSKPKLEKLLAEEPTEKRTQYMIDTEIKAEAEKLRDAGKLTSETADKIRARGIAI